MAEYNPAIKRYAKDLGIPVPNVRFCPSERPRLNTWPAPYLPFQLENERHDEFYVILTGKVIALDSRGFFVPAGLKLQLETFKAEVEGAVGGNLNASGSNAGLVTLERYTQTDVDNSVVNARGVLVKLNEPVVYSMIDDDAAALPGYDEAAAGTSTAIPIGGGSAITEKFSIGDHIGFAPYSWLRCASDVMERAVDANELHPTAASGPEASLPKDPTQLRHLAWELQDRGSALVADECLVYPVVTDRTGVLVKGQAVAIGANMAAFSLGARVTYDANSDIVPHSVDEALLASEMDGNGAATDAAAVAKAIERYADRCIGQVVRKNTRHPSSLLDKVKTRWEASISGFTGLDRMPGSATSGMPWHMHTAGTTHGELQISPLMR